MFRQFGRFAPLALCLFALVIAMGSCGGDDDDTTNPPIELPKEKTFKEQLVESSWRPVSNATGKKIDALAQELADIFAQDLGVPATGRMSQNSLRFDTSGNVNWTYEVNINVDDPAGLVETLKIGYTLKGSYWISEDFGSAATITLSFTEVDVQALLNGEVFNVPAGTGNINEVRDILNEERASINGNQLRLGKLIAERVD